MKGSFPAGTLLEACCKQSGLKVMLIQTLFAILPALALSLSPPWYTFATQVKVTFGADPIVSVGPLVPGYSLTVTVDNEAKATAIASILTTSKSFGNVNVAVNVVCNGNFVPSVPLDASSVEQVIFTALNGNPLYSGIVSRSGFRIRTFVLFKPVVLQYFNDNFADPFGKQNMVAADVWKEVLRFGNLAGISTAEI